MARRAERVATVADAPEASWRRPRRRNGPGALVAFAALGILASVASPVANAQSLPAGFQESVVFSGLTQPTALAFAPDGRVFVAEKSGLLKVFSSLAATSPTVFADLRTRVHNFWDRGLLGLALHPGFPATPYVYVLYAHDAAIGGTAPRWGTAGATTDPCPNPPGANADGCVVSGRLSRLTAAGSVMSGPEQVLIEDWCQQYPSHSVGALAFGADGALYVSGGDGASFTFVDYGQDGAPLNPCGDPPAGVGGSQTAPGAEGGSLRSQSLRRVQGPVVLGGTILRVDPDTGLGLPDNPLAASADVNARRIVAQGLRNPFRFTVRPGTSEIWVGDVGWTDWEEIGRITAPTAGVVNFGWPCYEGSGTQSGYDGAGLAICEALYGQAGAATPPFYAYHHAARVVPGEPCPTGSSSVAGLAFYSGGSYPAAYTDALFFADYSRRCIWVMFAPSGQPDPSTVATFVSGAAGPVDLKIGPGGDLFYVDFDGGTVRRVRHFGPNTPPSAVIQAAPTSGPAPLTVSFDGSASSDPDPGDQVATHAWDLDGDGQHDDATTAQTSATYSVPGTYTVGLRVTDGSGAAGVSSIVITVGNAPPTAIIDAPLASATWQVGDTILFSGRGTDPQEGALPASRLSWAVVLHHCATQTSCHTHPLLNFVGVAGDSFVAPDHSYPSHLELRLTATDSGGLTHTQSRLLQPQTTALTLQSSPAGLQLALNGTGAATPFTHTVIVGSQNSVSASSPQAQGGGQYTWLAWSDGGAQTHLLTAGASGSTYTATYAAAPPNAVGNPGFEGGTAWQKTTSGGRAVVTTQAHSGSRSQQMLASDLYPREVFQDVGVVGGAAYDAAGWVMTSGVGGAGAAIQLHWRNGAGAVLRADVLGSLTGTQPWTRLTGRFTAPGGASNVRILLFLPVDPDNAGGAWFDDVDLVRVGSAAAAAIAVVTSPASQTVASGADVTLTFRVTNPGGVDLTGVSVSEPQCDTLVGPSGDDGDQVLEPPESWTYGCTVQAVTASFTSTVTATALGGSVSDTDSANVVVVTAGPNRLSDPGFESGGTGWQKTTSGGRAVVTAQAHSGSRSQQMLLSNLYPREVYQDVPVTAGATYQAAGWIMTSGVGGTGAGIELEWRNGAGAVLRIDVLGTLVGSQAWMQLARSLTAPAGATTVRFRLVAGTDPDNAGGAWFDDAELR